MESVMRLESQVLNCQLRLSNRFSRKTLRSTSTGSIRSYAPNGAHRVKPAARKSGSPRGVRHQSPTPGGGHPGPGRSLPGGRGSRVRRLAGGPWVDIHPLQFAEVALESDAAASYRNAVEPGDEELHTSSDNLVGREAVTLLGGVQAA